MGNLNYKNLIYVAFVLNSAFAHSQELDKELLESLKLEANHNLNRLKSLKIEKKNNKVFDEEREKSLGTYLEDQEKWDIEREKGLIEYRKQKRNRIADEETPEYKQDQKEKKALKDKYEKNRAVQVRTRNQILIENPGVIAELESDELGLLEKRPRFELRKRGQNKWVKSGASGRPSTGSSSGGYVAPIDTENFPPPPVDYIPSPPPMENYDDIPPPPPPPPNYDYGAGLGNPGYDSGYGGDIPPPPPPPPPDYDF